MTRAIGTHVFSLSGSKPSSAEITVRATCDSSSNSKLRVVPVVVDRVVRSKADDWMLSLMLKDEEVSDRQLQGCCLLGCHPWDFDGIRDRLAKSNQMSLDAACQGAAGRSFVMSNRPPGLHGPRALG